MNITDSMEFLTIKTASMRFWCPIIFVLTLSNELVSQTGTCFKAAALITISGLNTFRAYKIEFLFFISPIIN
jgi:hypothetical protein